MKMTRDELEYAISQYLDGTLPLLERASLEERLASDREAREILAEYQALNATLKSAMPVPNVAWDRFAQHISASLADEPAPVKHFSIAAIGWSGRLAIAAVLLFAITLAIHFAAPEPMTPGNRVGPPGSAVVIGPTIDRPAGPETAEISIGPAPSLARDWRINQEVITRPTVVLIDQARTWAQDGDGFY